MLDIFPDKLKIAKLFKKGDSKSFDHYRPISLLPSITKNEKVIYDQTYSYFQKYVYVFVINY